MSVDDIIARRKLKGQTKKRKREPDSDDEEDEEEVESDLGEDEDDFQSEEEEEEEDAPLSDEGEESEDPLATSDEDEPLEGHEDVTGELSDEDDDQLDDASSASSDSDSEEETEAQKERKAAFFASPTDPELAQTSAQPVHTSFTTMSLSRPLLKSLTAMGFSAPTPIQAATIPVALLGKDVVGNAVTGSGKTAAFMIPVLERLMYRERGKNKAAVRCVVLVPTRELGVQCADVARKLAALMDVRISLIVGEQRTIETNDFIFDMYDLIYRWSLNKIARVRTPHAARHSHCNTGATHRPSPKFAHLRARHTGCAYSR